MAIQMLLSFFSTLLMLGVAGVAVAWALLRGLKPRTVIGVGVSALTLFLATGFLLELSVSKDRQKAFAPFTEYLDQEWKAEYKAMLEDNVPQDQIEMEKAFREKYIVWCVPAWSIFSCLLIGLVAYYLVSSLLSRITKRVSPPIPFRDLTVPEWLIFGLIIGGIIKVIPFENHWMEVVGNNLLVFFLGLYALSGFSLLSFLFHKLRLVNAFRLLILATVLGLFFGAIFTVITVVCIFLGVLDVWLNFRKRKPALPEALQ